MIKSSVCHQLAVLHVELTVVTQVAAIWVLDAMALVLSVHVIYYYMFTNFGNFLAFVTPIWYEYYLRMFRSGISLEFLSTGV